MAGDLRDLKAKLLEAQKAEKKPQAVSQKQEPPRTKLTLKKQGENHRLFLQIPL